MTPQPNVYTLLYSDRFNTELGTLQKSVRKKVIARSALLRETPTKHSLVKRLTGYKQLWRLRVGEDYRAVYLVNQNEKTVTLMKVAHRSKVYSELGEVHASDKKTIEIVPSPEIVASHPEMVEPEPTPTEIGEATVQVATTPPRQHGPDVLLPNPPTQDQLVEWNIPKPFHALLEGVETEEQILSVVGLPPEWHDRILSLVDPPSIGEVLEQPVRLAPAPDAAESAAVGEVSLASFLLKLDSDQEALLEKYDAGNGPGPWLVKGGPGSGKTIVALYAIRDVIYRTRVDQVRPRILFTTYTRALSTFAEQLLRHLGIDPETDNVQVATVDKLARNTSPAKTSTITPNDSPFPDLLKAAVKHCITQDRSFPYSVKDEGFLMEEVEWVILGRGITERDSYLQADRSGRSRKLDASQRRHLWSFHLALRVELESANRRLFEDVVADAVQHAVPAYDFVFVDEVHDLKPLALKLCVNLCKEPQDVFLTLDPNQSIYGARQEWAESLPRSMAAPRSVVLRKNHRSTAEIWDATQQILNRLEVHDPETLAAQGDLSGPEPLLVSTPKDKEGESIAAFLHTALIEERVGPDCAAVLCPTNYDCHSVKNSLPARFRARVMKSTDFDLDHTGVKVMTMHAAKGLQYPVVVVARMERGRFPSKAGPGIDPRDHDQQNRRLLFVACSRAMRRLMVIYRDDKPSPLLEGLDDGAWQVDL